MNRRSAVTRRSFLHKSAVGAVTATAAGGLLNQALAASTRRSGRAVPLPSAGQFRADVQRMVDFGPRLPGYVAHNQYCDWLEEEFVKAGLQLQPCDEFMYDRWQLGTVALDVLDGPSPGPLKVAFPYVRSAGTPPGGLVAPLSYAGSGGGTSGTIFVVDLSAPAKATAAAFLPLSTYRYWPGHTDADWAAIDYKRAWVGPWPSDLSPFAGQGAKAVVFIADASYEGMRGTFTPHQAAESQPIPAVIVDRATGNVLRQQALAGQHARLTLDAPRQKSTYRSITAILPGESQETVIVDTHTDGQNAVEENAGPALVAMARHFASLPPGQRLKRTLVFGLWSAHMTDNTIHPQADGWIAAHPDLVKRAVASVTIEHLGCTEWIDDPLKGYYGTGENEIYGIWTSQGPTFDLAQTGVVKHNLVRHLLLRGPVEFTVGAIFQQIGVPMVGGIAGPEYLLAISNSGEIEKLNFDLAARQIEFYADMVRAFDTADPAALRAGDPTLGAPTNAEVTPGGLKSKPAVCGPAQPIVGHRVAVRFYGHRPHRRGVLLTVAAIDAPLAGLTVELRRAKTIYARSGPFKATHKARQLTLRRQANQTFPPGTYSLIVRQHGKVLARRTVHLKSS